MFFVNLIFHFLDSFFANSFAIFFGISFIIFFVAICYNLLILPIKFKKFNPNRREFLKKIFDLGAVIASIGVIFNGFYNVFKSPKITNLNIAIKNLKDEICIVQITDLHIGNFLGIDFLEKIVLQINALKPDIVAITGDIIDFAPSKISEILAPLNGIKSTYGTFFVPGNHEYYVGIEAVMYNLKSLNLEILANRSVKIAGVNIVGLLDFVGKGMNLFEPDTTLAFSQIDENLPTILLTHQPRTLSLLDKNQTKSVDLALLGHTHGGQIFPFHFFVKLANKYLYGLYRQDNMQIYVSSGAGFWGPPIRFLSQSEIVKINLKGE